MEEDYDKELDEILTKAKISPMLRKAVEEIKEAEKKGDDGLVADLSTVKLHIFLELDPEDKDHAFQEDGKYNVKKIGYTVYDFLDEVNMTYSLRSRKIPASIILFSSNGIKTSELPKPKSPVLKRILFEHNNNMSRRLLSTL